MHSSDGAVCIAILGHAHEDDVKTGLACEAGSFGQRIVMNPAASQASRIMRMSS